MKERKKKWHAITGGKQPPPPREANTKGIAMVTARGGIKSDSPSTFQITLED